MEFVFVKCLLVSLQIACNHCSLKCLSVGMLKNPNFRHLNLWILFDYKVGHINTDSALIYIYSRRKRYKRNYYFHLHTMRSSVNIQCVSSRPRFHVLVPRLTRAVGHYEFGVLVPQFRNITSTSCLPRNVPVINTRALR